MVLKGMGIAGNNFVLTTFMQVTVLVEQSSSDRVHVYYVVSSKPRKQLEAKLLL